LTSTGFPNWDTTITAFVLLEMVLRKELVSILKVSRSISTKTGFAPTDRIQLPVAG